MPSTPELILWQTATSATPLLLAGYGELAAQRGGVINVGIEGTMLMGAIAAYAGAVYAGTAAAALPLAAGVGILCGALFALATVWMRADQIVAGTAMNLLAAGASTTAYRVLQPYLKTHPVPPLFDPWSIPHLSTLPLIGRALFGQYPLFYLAATLGVFLWAVMARTRTGLVVRALGDAPAACEAAGVGVRAWRTGLLLIAGALAGLAGAYLSTMRGHSFQIMMTGGQGFLVLALVIFGRWSVPGLVVGTAAFAAVDAVQRTLASEPGATAAVPHQLFDMLPYAATLAALAVLSRGRAGPAALGKPWPE